MCNCMTLEKEFLTSFGRYVKPMQFNNVRPQRFVFEMLWTKMVALSLIQKKNNYSMIDFYAFAYMPEILHTKS